MPKHGTHIWVWSKKEHFNVPANQFEMLYAGWAEEDMTPDGWLTEFYAPYWSYVDSENEPLLINRKEQC